MKAEVDSGERPEAPARGAVSAKSTPKKVKSAADTRRKDMTIGGRVSKSIGTPTKKRGNGNLIKGIKEEPDSG